ncbi:neutral zinc metallopeptidase [Streptosporangium canum]|uniref:neutral zinc metallopeptidase n=1 Tax=Streptosporangium canum TaxID=324952 RepID=UPI00342E73C4
MRGAARPPRRPRLLAGLPRIPDGLPQRELGVPAHQGEAAVLQAQARNDLPDRPPHRLRRLPRGAQAVYCPINKKITFFLSPSILSQPTELFLFQVMAHEYGHHVQQLSGIMGAVDSRTYKSDKDFLPVLRQVELQAECLSGAFIGSVWQSLGRRQSDFTYVLRAATDTASHGKAANIAYWLERGFDQEGPGACNTFSAPKSKVA